jgi:hypothetical protein
VSFLNALRARLGTNGMIAIAVLLAVIVVGWLVHYNSDDQRLQRCVHAEWSAYDADPKSQYLYDHGVPPPVYVFTLDCKQKLGIH